MENAGKSGGFIEEIQDIEDDIKLVGYSFFNIGTKTEIISQDYLSVNGSIAGISSFIVNKNGAEKILEIIQKNNTKSLDIVFSKIKNLKTLSNPIYINNCVDCQRKKKVNVAKKEQKNIEVVKLEEIKQQKIYAVQVKNDKEINLKTEIQSRLKNTIWKQYNDGKYCCDKIFLENNKMSYGPQWQVNSDGSIIFDDHELKIVGEQLLGFYKEGTQLILKYQMKYDSSIESVGNINLFVQVYKSSNQQRQKQLDFCLMKNKQNKNIKVYQLNNQDRVTFKDFFKLVNNISGEDDINIIANSDIVFDDSVIKFKRMSKNTACVVGRWEGAVLDGENINNSNIWHQHKKNGADSWVFRGKIKQVPDCDFGLGIWGCDTALAERLRRTKYYVVNPSLDIYNYHIHKSNYRTNQFPQVSYPWNYQIWICSIDELVKKNETELNEQTNINFTNKIWRQYNDDNFCCLKIFLQNNKMSYSPDWVLRNKEIKFDNHVINKFTDNQMYGYYLDGTRLTFQLSEFSSKKDQYPQFQKYFSFCLFGNKDIYINNAIRNMNQVKIFFPGWKIHVAICEDVNEKIKKELQSGCDKVSYFKKKEHFQNMVHRYLIDECDIVCYRDIDAIFNQREIEVVNDWVKSDYEYHVIHDHEGHIYSVDGGLWGVKGRYNISQVKNIFQEKLEQNFSGMDIVILQKQIFNIIKNKTIDYSIMTKDFGFKERKQLPRRLNESQVIGDGIRKYRGTRSLM